MLLGFFAYHTNYDRSAHPDPNLFLNQPEPSQITRGGVFLQGKGPLSLQV